MNRTIWALATVLAAVGMDSGMARGEGTVKTIAHFHDFTAGKQANGVPEGWNTWAARSEIAPRFSVEAKAGRTGHSALRIAGGGNPAAVGAWRRRVEGIVGGRPYHFVAYYRTRGITQPKRCVAARLDWQDAAKERARPPDYALDTVQEGDWTRVEYDATAPENARSVVIELSLGWAGPGAVWWDDIRLVEQTPAKDRVVRAMTVYHRPRDTKSSAESVEQFCRIVEAAAAQKPDVVCLPEGVTQVGTGKPYAEVSEPIPGPTTRRLGELAKKLQCYVVAGIYERTGTVIYNTAVLIGRGGEVAGRYRKTHLPREEVEAGLTPGDSYPVFQTDFGKIGILICWDVQFPEPARALGLQGAELILLPIWGGSEILARARAIENHLFLVTSSYDMKTFVVDPTGAILGEATFEKPVAVAELHLDRKIQQPWLGDMKPRTWKERRPDIPLP